MKNFTLASCLILVGLFASSCSNHDSATTPNSPASSASSSANEDSVASSDRNNNNPETLASADSEPSLGRSFGHDSFAKPTTFLLGKSTLIVQNKLGAGGSGVAFEGTFDGAPVVAKAGASESELEKMTYLDKHVVGVSPKIYGHFRAAAGKLVIIEERMQSLVYNNGHVVEFLGHLQRMHAHHLYHADIHPGNVMANSDNSGRFIDFGNGVARTPFFSHNGFSEEHGEVVALGRTLLQKKYATDIDEAAQADLRSIRLAPEAAQMFSNGHVGSWIRRSPKGEFSLNAFKWIHLSLAKLKIAEEIFARERSNYPELKDITDLNTSDWSHPLCKKFDEAAEGLPSFTEVGFLNEFKAMILKKKGELDPDDELLFDMAVGKYESAKSALDGFGEK